MSIPIATTIERLFHLLEKRHVRYAVLRNYEHLPSLHRPGESGPHTDIDLVVDSRDLDMLRQILAGVAELDGWDALTECDHWAQSPIRCHNIEVFRFYRMVPLDYLQVDVFHGYLLWALPLFDEQQLLSGCIYDQARSLTRLEPLKENIFRLFQIAGHVGGSARKVARYRAGVLAFRANEPKFFEHGFRSILSGVALGAVDALKRSDMTTFLGKIRLVRTLFTMRAVFRNPFRVFTYIIWRIIDHAKRFLTRQCGCVIRVFARSEFERGMLRGLMTELLDHSFIDDWKECEAGTPRSWHDHVIMEQGAILIEWTGRGDAHVDLSVEPDRLSCAGAILGLLIARHKRLYCTPYLAGVALYEEVAR